jgi:molecular chaperone GrpE (heat shock protein)
VAHVESAAQPPGSVVDEYVPGYRLHDRLLRPAQVTVAKPGRS